jgi:EmrB/QacA subfamily drug resistance transporter
MMDSTAVGPGDAVVRPPSVASLILLTSLGAILAPLNSTMIAVALPEIRSEFGLSHGQSAWLVSGYLIAMAVAQPLGGRLGDQVGRAQVYRTGLIAFMALSIGAMLAPNFALLVTFRIGQAVAGAVLIPNAMAMLRTLAPPDQLARLNGINGSILSGAAALGPLLGAAALAAGSWRLVFPLSIPLILAALLLLQRMRLPEQTSLERTPIDWLGGALFVGLLGGITLQLASLREDAAARWALLGAVAIAFAWRQRRTPSPAADWPLFRSRSFSGATAWVLLTNLSMYTTLLMIPFFVRDVQDRGTQLAGLLLGAMSVLVTLTSPIGGRLADAWGRRPLAIIGALLALAGSAALLAVLDSDTPPAYLAACLALLGFGLGLGMGAATTAAVESAPRERAGSAAGTSSMMRYAGSILGAGALAGILSDASDGDASVATFRVLMAAVVATAALAVVAGMFIHRFPGTVTIAVDTGDEAGQQSTLRAQQRAGEAR